MAFTVHNLAADSLTWLFAPDPTRAFRSWGPTGGRSPARRWLTEKRDARGAALELRSILSRQTR